MCILEAVNHPRVGATEQVSMLIAKPGNTAAVFVNTGLALGGLGCAALCVASITHTHTHTHRQTDRQTMRQTDRQTDTPMLIQRVLTAKR